MFDLAFFEELKKKKKFQILATDEVGRGPLAGPVVSAAVSLIVKKYDEKEIKNLLASFRELGVNDSKKLSSLARKKVLSNFHLDTLLKDQVFDFSLSKNVELKIVIKEISAQMIDEINILQASLLSMKFAVEELWVNELDNGIVLIDGNKKFKFKHENVKLETIVKGDSKSVLIGLASVVAKEYRDLLMEELGREYPEYGWGKNAGYPTKTHLGAIKEHSFTKWHRLSFKGVKEFYEEGRAQRS